MNLINDLWIPIKRESGKDDIIAPWQITESVDPVVSLNPPRADFHGALLQFLIGLLQTATPPESDDEWINLLESPPDPSQLREKFYQWSNVFELNGELYSFMQDFEPLGENSSEVSIEQLLIDAPRQNTIKKNTDHFVKRGNVQRMCFSCTAIALFTLQINAPTGGKGHRTSIRGGGPLTTLVVVDEKNGLPERLWSNIWLNVLNRSQFSSLTGNNDRSEMADIFPWCTKTRTSEKSTGVATTPLDVHPLHMYWSMPRRIKILWSNSESGECGICNAVSNELVTRYRILNYGNNYTGAWQHPLSPYHHKKDGDPICIHAQPGGITYNHWLEITDSGDSWSCAKVVQRFREYAENWEEQFRLHAFGYDNDNMKARGWYDSTFPLLICSPEYRIELSNRMNSLTEAANITAKSIRACIGKAWFRESRRGDTKFLVEIFYESTESEFYRMVHTLNEGGLQASVPEVFRQWHKILCANAFEIFDTWTASTGFEYANPKRVVNARTLLRRHLYSRNMKNILQL